MLRDFRFFIVLCLILIFPNGILNHYFPDMTILKFLIEIPIFILILISIFRRTPQKDILKFSLLNGLIFFTSFELRNYFTYTMVGNSKYFENWKISLLLGIAIFFILTLMTAFSSKVLRKTFVNRA